MERKHSLEKRIKSQKKQKIQNIFSKILVGGASVATVVVVTATSFFVPDFYIETFSDTIYYETIIEPNEISYPEDVDPNDPDVEIVFEEVDLRLRLSSQFGEIYQPLTLFENKGKFSSLNPNTNYELTVQHYNGFQWVNLKSENVRTEVENKASIVDVIESGDITSQLRQYETLIFVEAEPTKVRNIRLDVIGDKNISYPLINGENIIIFSPDTYQTSYVLEVFYEILTEDEWIETKMTRHIIQSRPFVDTSYEARVTQLEVEFSIETTSTSNLEYFAYVDREFSQERYDDISILKFINYVDLDKIRIYGLDLNTNETYLIDTIDLTNYKKFPFIATILDNQLSVTIVDELERIQDIYLINIASERFEINDIQSQDNVLSFEIEMTNIDISHLELMIQSEYTIIYTIELKGETS